MALWLLQPLAYLLFALTRGALLAPARRHYPYLFLDVATLRYAGVLPRAVVMDGPPLYAPAPP
ncbi:hypothetical protein [Streptomyces lavendofoliae]|uniref:hypothetical protein n=1 Tax=Streptomyces lavendofoliae TaxID=67314 RepID=UPI003D911647